ncbi:cytochrome P450 [Bradyrhizobium sp. USDA 4502]
MNFVSTRAAEDARAAAYAAPLAELNPYDPALFASDTVWPYFERLRRESPVHYTAESPIGPYWSITKYKDIMDIEIDHETFSSAAGIALPDGELDYQRFPMFIAMDPPKHDDQRRAVSPAVAPANLALLEPLIRERAADILDNLPIGEPFNWVDKVSMELTAMTLATLFGIPQEDRRRLTRWSDVSTAIPGHGLVETAEQKVAEMSECFAYFVDLWNKRVNSEPGGDLISMLAHSPATRNMDRQEYFGNLMLLIVGGNDTTRNTITGSVYALNRFPDQYLKLKENLSLLPSMVSETIRWQTPLAYMRRTAKRNVEFRGRQIRKGDKVALWYASGNRDDESIERADEYIIDRPRVRQHLSFGFGIHRCVGNRLAELQLKLVWQEMLTRFPEIVVLSEPKRTFSAFVKGYESMQVIIPARV